MMLGREALEYAAQCSIMLDQDPAESTLSVMEQPYGGSALQIWQF
jgi:hypothetical protein